MQLEFGRGLESLLGETGRYPTANLEAMAGLPWPSRDFSNLKIQLASARAMPEVPGGYFVSRHVDNAFRTVIYDNKDAREVLYDYALTINKEIDTKRKEFQLPLYQD